MRLVLEFLATLSTVLFCGAAIYINLVEHPARMSCGTAIAVTEWAPSYQRPTFMQAPLAIVGFLCGTGAWILGGPVLWLLGALLIGLVVPFTFMAIMPTNHRLLEAGRDPVSSDTRDLLEKWARLHAVRSVLSAVASTIYIGLLV